MRSIWKAALSEMDSGRDFALATILQVRGHSPREAGTRFIVRHDRSIEGTIGGGLFEADVQSSAVRAMEERTSSRVTFRFQGMDTHSDEMICGGEAHVLVEYVRSDDTAQREVFEKALAIQRARTQGYLLTRLETDPAKPFRVEHLVWDASGAQVGGFCGGDQALGSLPDSRALRTARLLDNPGDGYQILVESLRPVSSVLIFGAGHVGEAVAHLAAFVDFAVTVVDDRPEFASLSRIPDADKAIVLGSFDLALEGVDVDEDTYVIIVTRGHAHDKTVLAQALRTEAAYVGMIGSRRKNKLILEALLEEGFSKADIQRVHAPIGLPIGGDTPQEIAVSIVAQLIQVRDGLAQK